MAGSSRAGLAGSCTTLVLFESGEGVVLHLQGLGQDQLLLTETQSLQAAPARLAALLLSLSRRHDGDREQDGGKSSAELEEPVRTHGAAEDQLRTERADSQRTRTKQTSSDTTISDLKFTTYNLFNFSIFKFSFNEVNSKFKLATFSHGSGLTRY